MKIVYEILKQESNVVVELPALLSKFVFSFYEGDLFFNKFSEMSALSCSFHKPGDPDDKITMCIFHQPQEGFVIQDILPALAESFSDHVEKAATALVTYMENIGILGENPRYVHSDETAHAQLDKGRMKGLASDIIAETFNRVFGMSLRERDWAEDCGIEQGGVFCPTHKNTGLGNVVTLAHYTGVSISMAPDACGFDEGETNFMKDDYEKYGGFWFSVFIGDVKYRGHISHPRYRLENQTPRNYDDIKDTVIDLIRLYYPIIFSSKDVVAMFDATFKLGDDHVH